MKGATGDYSSNMAGPVLFGENQAPIQIPRIDTLILHDYMMDNSVQ